MARVQLPESKLRARKRRHRVVVVALWATLALLFVGGIAFATHLPHIRIVEVTVTGVEGTEAQSVVSAVKARLAGNYLFIFPRNNVLLYPRSSISAELLRKNPMYASIDINPKNPRALEVVVAKRTPKSIWCGEARLSPSPCLLLDERGVAYEAAPAAQQIVYTSYFGLLKGNTLPRQYLTEEEYRSLVALVLALEADQESRIATVEVDGTKDVRMRFAGGFELIFALKDGGGDVYERFTLALTAEPFTTHSLSSFEYLDLRFGDRLYYKLKGE